MGLLQELMAVGVPTTDNLEEALRSEGRLAFMPPKGERPSPSAASVTLAASLFAQSSVQVPSYVAVCTCEGKLATFALCWRLLQ